jgi:hypothetical protein
MNSCSPTASGICRKGKGGAFLNCFHYLTLNILLHRRFANMDYIFASILRHKDPRIRKIISYDIVCQWWKNLLERLQKLPILVRITVILHLFRFVIPKMHIHAHTLACQLLFSLNLVPGSGQTDGEGIERPWASIGAIATSTRVSGPGARHDMLDDHWSFWNWLKTIGLRECSTSSPIGIAELNVL